MNVTTSSDGVVRGDSPSRDLAWDVAWYAASFAVLLVVPSYVWRGLRLWQLPLAGQVLPLLWATGFLAFALGLSIALRHGLRFSGRAAIVLFVICYGPAALALRRPDLTWSHVESAATPLLGTVLALLPHLTTSRIVRSSTLGVLCAALLCVVLHAALPALRGDVARRTVPSALYSLRIEIHPQMAQPSTVTRGGAIDIVGNRYVLAAADGSFYALEWKAGHLRSRRLPLVVPIEAAAFAAGPKADGPKDDIRVTDMVLDLREAPPRAFVAHQHWDTVRGCLTLRVSAASLDLNASTAASWTTFFETAPCLAPSGEMDTLEAGGRLLWDGDSLLLSVGDEGLALSADPPHAQADTSSYGKVLRLDRSGHAEIFTRGHRNPQGLAMDRDRRVWLAEQGPQGGDEINLLQDGGNYGWPRVTYGTAYFSHEWSVDPHQRNHGEFTEPITAFVPSVAISNLIAVRSPLFPRWQDDLLAGSLWGRSLFRVRMRDGRAIYSEQIPIGHRIRDIVEDRDGRILLWTDERDLVVLTPVDDPD